MQENLKVSVSMITYGHEKYIKQAIESVLMQQCNFEVELILSNDCSPDNTDEVIQNIIKNHPKSSWIKYFKQEENLGMQKNSLFTLKECSGQYIAALEGDDYWTDNLKLQKQVDYLEKNKDCILCFHKIEILKNNGEFTEDFITRIPDNYQNIETLARYGNYIHTPSVVFRNILVDIPFEYSLTPIGDFFLYMFLAQYGKLHYIDNKMAVYRHGVGVISKMSGKDIANNNVTMYSCMVSMLKDENIIKIILQRQVEVVSRHYTQIENKYEQAYISYNPLLLKILKFRKLILNPKITFKKIQKKFFNKS